MLFIACDAGVRHDLYCYSVVTLDSATGLITTYVSPLKKDVNVKPADAEKKAFDHACLIAKSYSGEVHLFTDQVSIVFDLEGTLPRNKQAKAQTRFDLMAELFTPVVEATKSVSVYKVESHKGTEVQDLLHKLADAECAHTLGCTKPTPYKKVLNNISRMFSVPEPTDWLLGLLISVRGY